MTKPTATESQISTERAASRYAWRYLGTGQSLHALVDPDGWDAMCGAHPVEFTSRSLPMEWFGTNDQAEYDRADSLPKCGRCLQRIRARVIS